MSCNCETNGKTVLNSILTAGVGTVTSKTYALDFTHWLCGKSTQICPLCSNPN